mmetsp:Transcript_5018/g.14041  ORF Transcript_5018/g.14041 Transcript_5018/m.14041 type:complete len:211 (+) Transcript_5018:223-855(+)
MRLQQRRAGCQHGVGVFVALRSLRHTGWQCAVALGGGGPGGKGGPGCLPHHDGRDVQRCAGAHGAGEPEAVEVPAAGERQHAQSHSGQQVAGGPPARSCGAGGVPHHGLQLNAQDHHEGHTAPPGVQRQEEVGHVGEAGAEHLVEDLPIVAAAGGLPALRQHVEGGDGHAAHQREGGHADGDAHEADGIWQGQLPGAKDTYAEGRHCAAQ